MCFQVTHAISIFQARHLRAHPLPAGLEGAVDRNDRCTQHSHCSVGAVPGPNWLQMPLLRIISISSFDTRPPKEVLTFSGLKFSVRGTFASLNKCLCLSAGIGAEKEVPEKLPDDQSPGLTLLWGALGATTRKNG